MGGPMRTAWVKPSLLTLRLREEVGRLAQSLRWGWDYELGQCYPGAVRELQDSERADMLNELRLCQVDDAVRRRLHNT